MHLGMTPRSLSARERAATSSLMTAAIARPSMICAVAMLCPGDARVDFAEDDFGQKVDLRERRTRAVRIAVRRRPILERLRIDSHVKRCPLDCRTCEERRTSD